VIRDIQGALVSIPTARFPGRESQPGLGQLFVDIVLLPAVRLTAASRAGTVSGDFERMLMSQFL